MQEYKNTFVLFVALFMMKLMVGQKMVSQLVRYGMMFLRIGSVRIAVRVRKILKWLK